MGKTGVDGKLLKEATGINLALHFLEHVIVCLQKRAMGENLHVPYRESLMTLVLRDSLGGNCLTRLDPIKLFFINLKNDSNCST